MARVLPIVRLFFPCDAAVLDLQDMTWSLRNPWHTVWMPPGVTERFVQREVWLYAQLTDGIGTFRLNVELLDEGGIVPQNQLLVTEAVFHMTNVPFPRPGLFTFKLKANYAELQGGTAELRALPGSNP